MNALMRDQVHTTVAALNLTSTDASVVTRALVRAHADECRYLADALNERGGTPAQIIAKLNERATRLDALAETLQTKDVK